MRPHHESLGTSPLMQAATASRASSSATRSVAEPVPAWELCSSPRWELCKREQGRYEHNPLKKQSLENAAAGARGAPWIAAAVLRCRGVDFDMHSYTANVHRTSIC